MNTPQYIKLCQEQNHTVHNIWTSCEYIAPKSPEDFDKTLDEYVHHCVELYETSNQWKQIVIKDSLYPLMFFHPKYKHGGVSCQCDCPVISATHHHLIGHWDLPTRSITRLFASWRELKKYTVPKGSNSEYSIKPIKNSKEFIEVYFDITTQKESFGQIYHGRFYPHGETSVSRMSTESLRGFRWRKINAILSKNYPTFAPVSDSLKRILNERTDSVPKRLKTGLTFPDSEQIKIAFERACNERETLPAFTYDRNGQTETAKFIRCSVIQPVPAYNRTDTGPSETNGTTDSLPA